jgi:hypothetical protein
MCDTELVVIRTLPGFATLVRLRKTNYLDRTNVLPFQR